MLFKWSDEVTEILKQLEQTTEGENTDNQEGVKIADIDFTDLSPEIVIRAAPTIQFSVSTVDEIEKPVRRKNTCRNIA